MNLGTPHRARSLHSAPIEAFTKAFGEGCYISQFQVSELLNQGKLNTMRFKVMGLVLQEPGRAEGSFARYDCLTVLKKFFFFKIDVSSILVKY